MKAFSLIRLLIIAGGIISPGFLAMPAFADVSVQEKEVLETVEKVAPTVEEIAKKLWDLSEVPLLEVKSSAYLKDLLKKNGFTITSDKASMMRISLFIALPSIYSGIVPTDPGITTM